MFNQTEIKAYQQKIIEEVKNCRDLDLLDFVYRLLATSGEDDSQKGGS